MTFVVNGADWEFDGMDAAAVERLLDDFLEFVSDSADREEDVFTSEDFQSRGMHSGLSLWELFSPDSPLALRREIFQELTGWLGRGRCYESAFERPIGLGEMDVTLDGSDVTVNPDVAWIHYSICSGRPTACLTLGASRIYETTGATGSATIHFVRDEVARKRFWRETILFEGDGLASLKRNAPHAYPNLCFVDGVLDHADALSGGYVASSDRVRKTLAILDDCGHWAFTCPPPSLSPEEDVSPDSDSQPGNQIIEKRLRGQGLDTSPEKPNVYRDRRSREAREVIVGGRKLYCEWHVKLEPHRNRIHFHAPVAESDNRVTIGVIHEHLPLP